MKIIQIIMLIVVIASCTQSGLLQAMDQSSKQNNEQRAESTAIAHLNKIIAETQEIDVNIISTTNMSKLNEDLKPYIFDARPIIRELVKKAYIIIFTKIILTTSNRVEFLFYVLFNMTPYKNTGARLDELHGLMEENEFQQLINMQDKDCGTLFMIAAVTDPSLVDALIKYKANINGIMTKTKLAGFPYIWIAIAAKDLTLFKKFIDGGADINLELKDKYVDLIDALFGFKQFEMLKYVLEKNKAQLLDKEGKPKYLKQHIALNLSNQIEREIAQLHIKRAEEQKIEWQKNKAAQSKGIEEKPEQAQTAAAPAPQASHNAAGSQTKKEEEIKAAHLANDGTTQENNAELLQYFNLCKSDLSNIDLLKTCKIFLSAAQFKKMLNFEDSQGNTLLIIACVSGNIPYSRELVSHGAYINYVSSKTNTSILKYSMASLNIKMVEEVLRLGANVNRTNGPSPLQVAIDGNIPAIVKLILNAPALDLSLTGVGPYSAYAQSAYNTGNYYKDPQLTDKEIKDNNQQIIKMIKEAETKRMLENKLAQFNKRAAVIARLNASKKEQENTRKALDKKKEADAALLLTTQQSKTAQAFDDSITAYLALDPEQRQKQDGEYNKKIKEQLALIHEQTVNENDKIDKERQRAELQAQKDAQIAQKLAQEAAQREQMQLRLREQAAADLARQKALEEEVALANALARKARAQERAAKSENDKKGKSFKKSVQSNAVYAAQIPTATAAPKPLKPKKVSTKEIEDNSLARNAQLMAETQAKIDTRKKFIDKIEKMQKKELFKTWKAYSHARNKVKDDALIRRSQAISDYFIRYISVLRFQEKLQTDWNAHQAFLYGNITTSVNRHHTAHTAANDLKQ